MNIKPTPEFIKEFEAKPKEAPRISEWCSRVIREIIYMECIKVENDKEEKK